MCGDVVDSRMSNPSFLLRPPQPGDLGWVVQRHGVLYTRAFGWGPRFEGLVAEIVAAFTRDFDPDLDRCWIAEKDGHKAGSVFLVRKEPGVAQLRLLLVEPEARGLGIGAALVHACSEFAREAGYETIVLWTNSVLHSARRIYEAEGYRKVREENHEGFGAVFIGEFWEMKL